MVDQEDTGLFTLKNIKTAMTSELLYDLWLLTTNLDPDQKQQLTLAMALPEDVEKCCWDDIYSAYTSSDTAIAFRYIWYKKSDRELLALKDKAYSTAGGYL